MTISLSKGQGISLTKDNPQLNQVTVGLGWDVRQTDGADFDLDATAFAVGEDGKVYQQPGIIGYMKGCETGADGSVVYGGDNRTGDGDGDDETLDVILKSVPAVVNKVVFAVTIHEAAQRGQNFGGVENSYVRVVNKETGEELCKYDLREDFDIETAMILGELYRHGDDWKFRAMGQGFQSGLEGLCEMFGVDFA